MGRILNKKELIELARKARQQAYAPYSKFPVGAALLCASGRVYTGCNVENISYGLTMCAERIALFKAVSEGEQEFRAIAVVTDNGSSPCGACRQVLSEFGSNMEIIIAQGNGDRYEVYSLDDLYPRRFDSID